jgi:hypothetical protein
MGKTRVARRSARLIIRTAEIDGPVSPDEALATAAKLARAAQNYMMGTREAGCMWDDIDQQIVEEFLFGLADWIHAAQAARESQPAERVVA